jgi:hypothetical protein
VPKKDFKMALVCLQRSQLESKVPEKHIVMNMRILMDTMVVLSQHELAV